MAGEDGPATKSLTDRLRDAPFAFDFFQAVRRLECANRDLPRVAHSLSPRRDSVRFSQAPSLAFASATLASCEPDTVAGVPRLAVNFLGLLGPNGPMPLHVTEYVHGRVHQHHDATMARFLDVFNHRMISLFYRAWADSKPTVSRDRPDEDRFGFYLACLLGLGLDPHAGRDAVPDEAKFHYAGRLGAGPGNAEGLCAILGDYFQVPARIEEFIGRWFELPPRYQCRLGQSPDTGSLGETAMIGSRFLDRQQTFRIVFGPLSWNDFQRFLPAGRSFRRLVDWVRNYTCDQFAWDVQLILKAAEVPQTSLGRQGMLGWTTWLSSRPFTDDSHDLVLRPDAA